MAAEEKTEKATPKRKKDERKKGNIFLSREIVVVFSLLGSFYSIKLLSSWIGSTLEGAIRDFVSLGASMDALAAGELSSLFVKGALAFFLACLPILLICALIEVALTMAQTKMLFSAKSFSFKGSRLNPINGLKKMISLRGVIELLKALLKIAVLGYIIYSVISEAILELPKMMQMAPQQAMAMTGDMILSIVLRAACVFVVLAVFDYIYQWWDYEKNLRMSKQEVKEEYKQTEGDPLIKGKIKDRQMAMSRQRMMQNVPSADVVVRNPTHYAVALKYDPDKNRAPVLVAKGADHLALKIVEVAEQSGVYIMENKPLARGLYEAVDLEREVPEKFYQAVAEVLAFVYSLREKEKKREDF